MITFGGPTDRKRATHVKRVKTWVQDNLPHHLAHVIVMVSELTCLEPNCAPVETVVSLLDTNKNWCFKIFQPVDTVQMDQVLQAMQDCFDGKEMPQHLKQVAAPNPSWEDSLETQPQVPTESNERAHEG